MPTENNINAGISAAVYSRITLAVIIFAVIIVGDIKSVYHDISIFSKPIERSNRLCWLH
ncbi:uncharacterized protein METZ01_LOCUS283233, partial [marine metagenome]